MKFRCKCDHIIVDQTDDIPYKAYIYPDQSMNALFNTIDEIFENKKPDDHFEYDRLTNPILHPKGLRNIYQCPECGMIWISNSSGRLYGFIPESDQVPRQLLKGTS